MSDRQRSISSQRSRASNQNKKISPWQHLVDYINNFLTFIGKMNSHANIHGLSHAVDLRYHPIERLMWLACFIAACWGAVTISLTQYSRYEANPTVVSLERDYREWNGTIPAISFCYHQRIDEGRAQTLIKRLWNIEKYENEYPYFMDYITAVVNITNTKLSLFNRFANDKRFDYTMMLFIVKEVHPVINSVISSFDNNAEFVLTEIITEKGICYTVNSMMAGLLSTKQSQKEKFVLQKPLSCYFLKNQCYMKLDVYDPTVFFAVHSPYEIPTNLMPFTDMGKTDEIEATYNMLETIASGKLRDLYIQQRKCLFYDESNEQQPVYSVNICNSVCKAQHAINMCGCRPYFYPFMNGTSCTASGLACLSVNNWPQSVKCSCPKSCAEIVYTQHSFKKINWAVDGGIPFTQKSSFRYEILAPRMRLRRDVLFSYEDLVVSFGGCAALFLGYNVWDFSEMIYYVTSSSTIWCYEMILKSVKKFF